MLSNQQFDCIKIKDGLYLGNLAVCEDYEFLIVNKLLYVVNCTSEVPNLFQQHGIKYLQFKLIQNKPHKLVGSQLKKIKKMQKFMDNCNKSHTCCLVHSYHGQNRSATMVVSYLMYQYQWGLQKTLDFVKSKAPNLAISEHYMQELTKLQIILNSQYPEMVRIGWGGPYITEEQELISKTFINSQQIAYVMQNYCLKKKSIRVKWHEKIDNKSKINKQPKQDKFMDYFQKTPLKEETQQQSKQLIDMIENSKESKNSRISKKKYTNHQDNIAYRSCVSKSRRIKGHKSKDSNNSDLKNQQRSNIDSAISPNNQDNTSNHSSNIKNTSSNKVYKVTINNFINPKFKMVSKASRQCQGVSNKKQADSLRRSGSSTGRSEKNSRVTSQKQPDNPYSISYKYPPKEKGLIGDKKSPKASSVKPLNGKCNPDNVK